MNGYLLDTHVAIWFLTGDTLLSQTADQIISEDVNRIYLSIISTWELAIKISIGKLRFPGNAAGFIQALRYAADIDKGALVTIDPRKTRVTLLPL